MEDRFTMLQGNIHDLDRLVDIFGGQLLVQSGQAEMHDGHGPRRFWRMIDRVDRVRQPAILNAQRIENSWAMRRWMGHRHPPWRTLTDGAPVVYLLRGRGRLRTATGQWRVAAGDLFVVPRGRPHLYGPEPGTRWDELSLRVAGPIFESWFGPGLLDPGEPIRGLLPVEAWVERFMRVLGPLVGSGVSDGPVEWGQLLELFATICEHRLRAAGPGGGEWLDRAMAALRAQPLTLALDLEQVAAELETSERTFRRRFSAQAGVTPHQWHTHRLMEEAQAMLARGLTLEAIAETLSFPNAYYLSRRFKQVTGRTATAYRQALERQ